MKTIHQFFDWLIQASGQFMIAFFTAVLAIFGKLSTEILNNRKITWSVWIAIIGVSLFWAWMAGLFCAYMNYSYIGTSIIVGIVTLMGEKINIYLAAHYKEILNKLLALFISKKD